MSLRMIKPWKNPRSELWRFRRRVPKQFLKLGMSADIKFNLETKDRDEAVLRCQEHNLRLERKLRYNLVGTPPTELSHLQIADAEEVGEVFDEHCTQLSHKPRPRL